MSDEVEVKAHSEPKKKVSVVHIYRDDREQLRYRGYTSDGEELVNPKAVFENRMKAHEAASARYPRARITFNTPKFTA